MSVRSVFALRRLAFVLFLAAGLGGCAVYGPPYAAYDPAYSYPSYGYSGYGYPTYIGPPLTLDLASTTTGDTAIITMAATTAGVRTVAGLDMEEDITAAAGATAVDAAGTEQTQA